MRLLYLFVIFIVPFSASASQECHEAPSTTERAECLNAELEELDKELNLTYQDAIKKLGKENKKKPKLVTEELRKGQRLWVKFIQEDCSFKSALFGGSSIWQAVEFSQCKKGYYKKRIYLLKIIAYPRFYAR